MTSTEQKFNKPMLWLITIAMMVFLGLADTVRGITMPYIRDEFSLNQEMVGRLTSLPLIGYTIFCFASGILVTMLGVKRSVVAGFFIMAASFALVMGAGSYWTVLLLFTGVSAACGFFEVCVNILGAVVAGEKAAATLNFIHFFYGVGAILGPLFVEWYMPALAPGESTPIWRNVFLILAIPLTIFAIIGMIGKFPQSPSEADKSAFGVMRSVMTDPLCWLLAVAMGLMMGIELGTKDWLPFYLRDCFKIAPERFVSAFYVCFSISRLSAGWVLEKTGYTRGLTWLLLATLAMYLVGFSTGSMGVYVFPVTGFTLSLLFPTIIAVAVREYPTRTAAAVAFIVTGGGVLTGLISWTTGFINHTMGSQWGYRFFVLYVLIALVVVALIGKRSTFDKQREHDAKA